MVKDTRNTPGNNHRGNKRGKLATEEHRRAQAELMWNDRLQGMTNLDIARKYNVGPRTVTNRFTEFPKENYEGNNPPDSSDKVLRTTETAAMWDDKINHHMTNAQLAEKYGISASSIQRRLSGYFPAKETIALERHRLREDDKLDMLEERAMQLLNKQHFVVDKGQVIHHPETGEPLEDSEPQFKAINTILKVIEAKRKMFGLDSPVRAEVKHTTDTTIEIQEVRDQVTELHRRNEEQKLRMLQDRAKSIEPGEEEVQDAEIVE